MALEKEAKALLQRNSELDQKNQTLQIDWNKLKKDHSDTLDKLETAQAEFARQQQIWQSERGELGGKVESIETAMEEFKADSIRKVATLTAELDHLRVKVSEAENERKKAEAKLVKFQKAWDQLEG